MSIYLHDEESGKMRLVARDTDIFLQTLIEDVFTEIGFGDIKAANIFSPLNSFDMGDARDPSFSAARIIRHRFANTLPPRVIIRNASFQGILVTKDCYDEDNVVQSLNLKADAHLLPTQSLANKTPLGYSGQQSREILRSAVADCGHHVQTVDVSGALVGPSYICISKDLIGWLQAVQELGVFTVEPIS